MINLNVKSVNVNFNLLVKDLIKSSKEIHTKHVYPEVKRLFDKEHQVFLNEYQSHPVTQELYAGHLNPGINYGGALEAGNLYAFFGFDGDDPAKFLYDLLAENMRVGKQYRVNRQSKGIKYNYRVYAPTMQQIFDATPLPWINRSWVKAVEKGLKGYNRYLRGDRINSRSTGGIQVKNRVRNAKFRNTKYLSDMYNKFIKNLSGKKQISMQ